MTLAKDYKDTKMVFTGAYLDKKYGLPKTHRDQTCQRHTEPLGEQSDMLQA